MTPDQFASWNAELRFKSPADIISWALAQADARAVVTTNFRPYEAVLLHLCVQVWPEIPVLWVDHGYNRPATYRHAEALRERLGLNLRVLAPSLTAARRDALYGPLPVADDEPGLERFSALMKLEPFARGMKELAPRLWFTALRKVQNPHRAGLDIVSPDPNFGTLKVSPVFHWSDGEMEDYLAAHNLPNEWDYHDPAKADEKRECGLHTRWVPAAA
ncbi:MAG TPA: phosphoadenosine phosphosulfate reductase family protein [Candidatus Acidoferrum sp.]|nr:phosphoadenosine phosphosulfate reductase family protein [Candidatus Acidoferrum sp.]